MVPQGSRAELEFGGPLGNGAERAGIWGQSYVRENWRVEL